MELDLKTSNSICMFFSPTLPMYIADLNHTPVGVLLWRVMKQLI